MFSSLRSRLWLSYALLVGVVMCMIIVGVVVTLIRNSAQERQATLRLRVAEADAQARL